MLLLSATGHYTIFIGVHLSIRTQGIMSAFSKVLCRLSASTAGAVVLAHQLGMEKEQQHVSLKNPTRDDTGNGPEKVYRAYTLHEQKMEMKPY